MRRDTLESFARDRVVDERAEGLRIRTQHTRDGAAQRGLRVDDITTRVALAQVPHDALALFALESVVAEG